MTTQVVSQYIWLQIKRNKKASSLKLVSNTYDTNNVRDIIEVEEIEMRMNPGDCQISTVQAINRSVGSNVSLNVDDLREAPMQNVKDKDDGFG